MMQKLVATLAGLILLVSMSIIGTPGLTRAADAGDRPAASWPPTITTNEATIVVYQPQVIAWHAYRTLEVRMAVAVTRQGATKPVLGAVEAAVDTQTDFDTRSVLIANRQLRSSRFPSLNTEQAAAMEQRLRRAMVDRSAERVPLDTILLSLKQQGSGSKGVALQE